VPTTCCTTGATTLLAVVEAKEAGCRLRTGVQQAREYAEILGLKFAYATNGHRIIEIDYTTGTEREVDRYATPEELFARLTAASTCPDPPRRICWSRSTWHPARCRATTSRSPSTA
jgi:predicted type IV restriction endonuclease